MHNRASLSLMPNDPENLSTDPGRRLPLRYALALIVALFALPMVTWLVWGWIESVRLDRTLEALEARHEPLDLGEFAVKATTDAQKEASHLYAAAGKLIGERAIPTAEAARISLIIAELCTAPSDLPSRTTQIQALRTFEEPYTGAFELIDRARPLKAVGWDDVDRPRRPMGLDLQPMTLARANVARIARLACTGDTDGAASALLSTLRLRHIWTSGPVPTVTAHSLELTLTSGFPPAGLLREIQDEYASAVDDRTFENWMRRERAVWLAFMVPGAFSDPPAGFEARRVTPLEAIATKLARPLRDHRAVAQLEEFNEAIEIAKLPWPSKFDAIHAFAEARPSRRSQSMREGLLEGLTQPLGAHMAANVLASYVNGVAEALARTRASAGGVAVARYRRDHAGAMPDTLQTLVPGYLPAPLIDPFSGGELKFRHDGVGYKIYSIGSNRKDDGGEWERSSDLQLSRRGNPLDIGIEVGSWPRKVN